VWYMTLPGIAPEFPIVDDVAPFHECAHGFTSTRSELRRDTFQLT